MKREAVLFIPAGEHRIWVDVLAGYAIERGYTAVAVVADFAAAVALWQAHPGSKLIAATLATIDDFEVVTVSPSRVSAAQRRPQRLASAVPTPSGQRPQLVVS